ncbi:T-complex protein 1 subunit beta, partial [Phenoliferia sp. Uapishka_3]
MFSVVEGYRIASRTALAALEASSRDNGKDPAAFREDLLAIARTTLSSKVLAADKDYFATLAVDAVLRLKGSTDLEHIQIIKKQGGKLTDSYLDEGFILDKKIGVNCPHKITNAKILIANTPMDTDKIKIFGARVRVDGTGKLAELERAEREKMKAKVAKIKAHGVTCFVNRQLIYNYPESLFAEAGIMSIEHADFEGVERLALVSGGEIASTFDNPSLVKLGMCDTIEEIMIGEDKLIKFSGVAAGEACTVVLRGATSQMVEEADRSLHDALSVLSQTVKETRTVLGGGCAEMAMAIAVDEEAKRTEGKKALAVESFARALRQIPTILADNAGFDSSDLVAKLRAAHYDGRKDAGLDMERGVVGSMIECGVTESYKLKRQVVLSASEAAEMILRVDDTAKFTRDDCVCTFMEENPIVSIVVKSTMPIGKRRRASATILPRPDAMSTRGASSKLEADVNLEQGLEVGVADRMDVREAALDSASRLPAPVVATKPLMMPTPTHQLRLSSSNPTTPSPIETWPWEILTNSFPDLFYSPSSPALPIPLPRPVPARSFHPYQLKYPSPFSTSPHSHPTQTLSPPFWSLERDTDMATGYPTPRSEGDGEDLAWGKSVDFDTEWTGEEGWPDGEQRSETHFEREMRMVGSEMEFSLALPTFARCKPKSVQIRLIESIQNFG